MIAGVAGAILAITALALMTGLAIILASTSSAFAVSGNDVRTIGGIVAAVRIRAVLGTAVGAAVRHQVAATLGVVVWLFVVENLGAAMMGAAGRYSPWASGSESYRPAGLGHHTPGFNTAPRLRVSPAPNGASEPYMRDL